MKFLVLGIVLYGYYHFFYKNASLKAGNEAINIDKPNEDDGEFTDYEEVE